MSQNKGSVGEAYGFFYYAGKDSISDALPYISKTVETPPEMTLELIEGMDNVDTSNDPALVEIVEKAKSGRLNHVLKASLPGVSNRMTASHLGDIMSGICTELYDSSEPFHSGIVYKRGEQYVFRQD
jgi:hypothetical protein